MGRRQQTQDFAVSLHLGQLQSCPAVLIFQRLIRAVREQQRRDTDVAPQTGLVQRRLTREERTSRTLFKSFSGSPVDTSCVPVLRVQLQGSGVHEILVGNSNGESVFSHLIASTLTRENCAQFPPPF